MPYHTLQTEQSIQEGIIQGEQVEQERQLHRASSLLVFVAEHEPPGTLFSPRHLREGAASVADLKGEGIHPAAFGHAMVTLIEQGHMYFDPQTSGVVLPLQGHA